MKDIGIYSGDEFYNCTEVYTPIVKGFLYNGEVLCLAARPKVGKSVFIQQLLFNLTTGTSFLGMMDIPKKCNVLYVQAEGTRQETIKRFKLMRKNMPVNIGRVAHVNRRDISLMDSEGLYRLINLAEIPKLNYDVIILDPLYKLMVGGNMNDGKDVTVWTNNADILFRHFGASGIVIHHDSEKEFVDNNGNAHAPKTDTLFGSTFWSGFFSTTYKLYKHKGFHYCKMGVQRSGENVEIVKMKYLVPQKDKRKRLQFILPEIGSVESTKEQRMNLLDNLIEKENEDAEPVGMQKLQ